MRNRQITEAVVLMAGAGSRLGSAGGALAKPLVQIAGRALICYTFEAFARAGIRTVHAVMGANSDRLTNELEPLVPSSIHFRTVINPDWRKQNGVSVLATQGDVTAPFILAMGDHLFEPAVLEALVAGSDEALVNLAVDRKIASIFDLDDATKVATRGDRLVAIGKELTEYDAIDTGVFLCSGEIFDYLRAAHREAGDCSLSDGVRRMAADGKVRAVDIADAWWQDVDTPEMLRRAEEESARLLLKGGRRSAEESVACER
jgi:1L-myo-inositol 1-phosphate cytidylyltransferase